jgi:threonine dehydratase
MSTPAPLSLAAVEAAARTLAGQVVQTPCLPAPRLSEQLGCALTLKFESFQPSSSFKDRGAYVKLASLTEAQRRRGVVAMSAGNHAQGVAYHAARLGIPATIVMPELTPHVKVEKTTRFGATALLVGDSVEAAAEHARRLAAEQDLVFIHPFDDPLVIAGQGTVVLEMLAAAPDLEVLVVPVGGGGLISGMAIAAKALKPGIELVGVQAAACPALQRQRAGLPPAPSRPTIADGIAVKAPGAITAPIVHRLVDELLLVEETALEEAILALLEVERTVIEGAGAAGLAAIASHPARFAGRKVGAVLTGGNIDLRILSEVILRGMVRSGRLIEIQVEVADAPGHLARIAALIGEAGGNIVEVQHQRAFSRLSVKATEMTFVIETRNAAHGRELVARLAAAGVAVRLLHAPS